MENASKALIIAGAILISILIIGLGVFIYQKVSTQVGNNTDLSEYEIQAFNSKFEKYEGTQTGSSVASLVSIVNANNGTNSQKVILHGTSGQNTFTAESTSTNGYSLGSGFSKGSTYNVTITGRSNGYISDITLEKK